MRSLTLVLPTSLSENPILDYALFWQSRSPIDFTYLVRNGVSVPTHEPEPVVISAGSSTMMAMKKVDTALKLNVKHVRYFDEAEQTETIANQSQYTDLLAMEKSTFIRLYNDLSTEAMRCPIFLPGIQPPITKAMVLMDVTSMKLALHATPLLFNDVEVILINCPECSTKDDKGLVTYAQSYFKRVAVIHLMNANNPYPIPSIADEHTILIADLNMHEAFRNILETILTLPQSNQLSFLINL
jgi:uncharacterized protein (UPF0212 family)